MSLNDADIDAVLKAIRATGASEAETEQALAAAMQESDDADAKAEGVEQDRLVAAGPAKDHAIEFGTDTSTAPASLRANNTPREDRIKAMRAADDTKGETFARSTVEGAIPGYTSNWWKKLGSAIGGGPGPGAPAPFTEPKDIAAANARRDAEIAKFDKSGKVDQQHLDELREANPKSAIGGSVLGGLLNPVGPELAAAKATKAVLPAAKSFLSRLGARTFQGSTGGVAGSAVRTPMEGKEITPEGLAIGAAAGGVAGGVVAPAIGSVARAVDKGVRKISPTAIGRARTGEEQGFFDSPEWKAEQSRLNPSGEKQSPQAITRRFVEKGADDAISARDALLKSEGEIIGAAKAKNFAPGKKADRSTFDDLIEAERQRNRPDLISGAKSKDVDNQDLEGLLDDVQGKLTPSEEVGGVFNVSNRGPANSTTSASNLARTRTFLDSEANYGGSNLTPRQIEARRLRGSINKPIYEAVPEQRAADARYSKARREVDEFDDLTGTDEGPTMPKPRQTDAEILARPGSSDIDPGRTEKVSNLLSRVHQGGAPALRATRRLERLSELENLGPVYKKSLEAPLFSMADEMTSFGAGAKVEGLKDYASVPGLVRLLSQNSRWAGRVAGRNADKAGNWISNLGGVNASTPDDRKRKARK